SIIYVYYLSIDTGYRVWFTVTIPDRNYALISTTARSIIFSIGRLNLPHYLKHPNPSMPPTPPLAAFAN
ncbi:hypothetical protein, partial [Chamaesiphon sp. VAR_69_metabat_338]|uniref:hypothetical protein n=1 Tax=Chamaesiphon sp. VAR_69_metabat_338 TaxID=2964704 RepID=UPI00286E03C2